MDDRYQNQPWWVKLWRRRHYLGIPYTAMKWWWYDPESRGYCWDIAIGIAQIPMDWYYTSEEVREHCGIPKDTEDMNIGTDNKLADSGSNDPDNLCVVDV